MSIGFLGPKGSYSYEAALKYKNENEEIVEFSTISKVIENLEKDNVERCIVPLENAIYGSVLDTMDAILEYQDIYN